MIWLSCFQQKFEDYRAPFLIINLKSYASTYCCYNCPQCRVSKQHELHQVSIPIWICSETQMIPTQSSSPIPYFLLVNIFPDCIFQVLCPVFASHFYTLSQWHPASFLRADKGCSQEGAAASHPEGTGLRAPLPSCSQNNISFPNPAISV